MSTTFGKILLSTVCAFALMSNLATGNVAQAQDAVESRVADLLSKLTFDEKVTLLSGTSDDMHVPGISRLGIPELKFSDGPVGVRVWGRTTAYPAGAMLAASWDAEAAREMGKALGRDCRARGVHVLLAPGVDLYRVPQNGRNFEYFGEDPYLSSQITVGYIKGLQSENVAACVKHYAANDQEILRDSIDTIIDERRLHEICLPPFKAAVQDANCWTVMAAYNKVNGDWCTANTPLLTDILRKQWGFKGILMSDWGAVHDCLGPLLAGTDLEMGHGVYYTRDNIKRLIGDGKLTQENIDEHVRRILRVSVAMNFFNKNQEDKSIPLDDPTSAEVALNLARKGLVLLKNSNDFLPLSREKVRNVVVLGPNACPAIVGGGGSSGTIPFRSVSLLDAVTKAAGSAAKVSYIPNWSGANPTAVSGFNYGSCWELVDGQRGARAEYFTNANLTGSPALSKIDPNTNFLWGSWRPDDQIKTETYSARWVGKIKPDFTDDYVFAFSSDGARVMFDGKLLFESSKQGQLTNASKTLRLNAGESHDVQIEYRHVSGPASMQFGWGRASEDFSAEQSKLLASADAVVIAGGFNGFTESEGFDRPYDLPADQVDLINRVSKLNPRTLFVLNSGGNVGMDKWIDGVSGLMHAWYPGQNGNTAVAEAIFGDLNPSGKLPDTFEKRWEDSPAFGNYPGTSDNGGRLEYKEGIYVGYRYYDKKNIAPRYPFGYGLSYTKFAMDDLKVSKNGSDVDVAVNVANTGSRAGTEVVQVYVRPLASLVDRPVQELKGFARVNLNSGEGKTVNIKLNRDAFATYDVRTHSWVVPSGAYEVAVGSSSRDIHCSQTVRW